MIIGMTAIQRIPSIINGRVARAPVTQSGGALLPACVAFSAPMGTAGPRIDGTSLSAVTLGLGTHSFIVEEYNRSFITGQRLRVTANAQPGGYMEGVVASYSPTRTLTITADVSTGGGTYADWFIGVAGQPGVTGPPGPVGPTGPVGEAPGDNRYYARYMAQWMETGSLTDIQNRVLRAGDAMTGPLSLPSTPAPVAANAVRKDYVDAGDSTLQTNINAKADKTYVDSQDATKLNLAGGTLTGKVTAPLTVDADAAGTLTTKGYVDTKVTSGFVPEAPNDGLLYGRRQTSGSSAWIRTVARAGDTMTGGLTVNGTVQATTGELQSFGFQGDVTRGVLRLNQSGSVYLYNDGIHVNVGGLPLAGTTQPVGTNDTSYATTAYVQAAVSVPAGSYMLFVQSSAPTGWTKFTGYNDRTLRVVNGTVGAGGVQPFSGVFGRTSTDSVTLAVGNLPSTLIQVFDSVAWYPIYGTPLNGVNGGYCGRPVVGGQPGEFPNANGIGNPVIAAQLGGGGVAASPAATAFAPTIDLRVQYVDVIIASKN